MNRCGSAVCLMVLALSACAASTREVTTPSQGTTSPHGVDQPQSTACDARTLSWSVGQLADDALIERARREAGANTVRVLRPGMMITNEVDPSRLNLRIDNARKVLVYSCG